MDISQHVSPGQWCSFWDEEGVHVGYLLGSNSNFSLFALATPQGHDDGLYLTLTDGVDRIEVSDAYTNRIEELFSTQKQEKRPVSEDAEEINDGWFCVQAHFREEMVTAYLGTGERLTGFVDYVTEETVALVHIDDEGREDGLFEIEWDDIVMLQSESAGERTLTSLYRGKR